MSQLCGTRSSIRGGGYVTDITLHTATLLQLSFKQAIPNLSNGSACSAPLESTILGIVENSVCPKHPVSLQNGHGFSHRSEMKETLRAKGIAMPKGKT